MKISTFSFTEEGRKLENRICQLLMDERFRDESLVLTHEDISNVSAAFDEVDCLIFIGATGIAMRKVAPLLSDKLLDPAIIVVDEAGQFVIPLASGHVGGANGLAKLLATKLEAIPVITTATDVEGVFSVDEFAAANNLTISDRTGIRKVAKKLLTGESVSIAFEDDVVVSSKLAGDPLLGLLMRPYVVGMGCKKDKDVEQVEAFFLETLEALSIDVKNVVALASIDVKANEPALVELARKYDLKFVTYSAKALSSVEGDFEESAFVEATVGVSDVSARAAKCAGKEGSFVLKKDKRDGMTISVFEKLRRVNLSYE